MSRVGFAGMTHLGLNHAAAAAERGVEVLCFDPRKAVIAQLSEGRVPVVEPGLREALQRNGARVEYSHNASSLASCDLLYVTPDVGTDGDGASDLGFVREVIELVKGGAAPGTSAVILSQVPPGFTRSIAQAQEGGIGNLRWYYQVETLIFGQAYRRALEPERFIVGRSYALEELSPSLDAFLARFECPIIAMYYESAELAKIAINCYLAASITTTNALADLCERIGARWDEIVPALRLDRRIGPHAYLAPGLGISGGNLERDLTTVRWIASGVGADTAAIAAFQRDSEYRKDWALRRLHEEGLVSKRGVRVGMLGLAYKQDTDSTKNSPALRLLHDLRHVLVRAYDPTVDVFEHKHPALERVHDSLAACEEADVVIIMTAWPEFRDLDPRELARAMRGTTVLDPFQVLDGNACAEVGLRRLVLGSQAD